MPRISDLGILNSRTTSPLKGDILVLMDHKFDRLLYFRNLEICLKCRVFSWVTVVVCIGVVVSFLELSS